MRSGYALRMGALRFSRRSSGFRAESVVNFGYNAVSGRGTQVVRERSAKPLYVGSIPTRASRFSPAHMSGAEVCELAFTSAWLGMSLSCLRLEIPQVVAEAPVNDLRYGL